MMDGAISYWQKNIAGLRVSEAPGHEVSWKPNKTVIGGVVRCSCGWKTRVVAGNTSGLAYGKAGAIGRFNAHCARGVRDEPA